MLTLTTSTLSKAQPVTGMAPATPVVWSRGVSKLPKGRDGFTFVTFTCIVTEPMAFVRATVIVPLDPDATATWKLQLPIPETIGRTAPANKMFP